MKSSRAVPNGAPGGPQDDAPKERAVGRQPRSDVHRARALWSSRQGRQRRIESVTHPGNPVTLPANQYRGRLPGAPNLEMFCLLN